MKTFLKITAVAAMFMAVVSAKAQNFPQISQTFVYTNFNAWSIYSNNVKQSIAFTSPFTGSYTVSQTQNVYFTTTVYPQAGTNSLTAPTTGAPWGTNAYAMLNSNVYTNVTVNLSPVNLFELSVSNASTNVVLLGWLSGSSQTVSNQGQITNFWSQLQAGSTAVFGGAKGFIPVGNLNAFSLVAGAGAQTNTSAGGLVLTAFGQ